MKSIAIQILNTALLIGVLFITGKQFLQETLIDEKPITSEEVAVEDPEIQRFLPTERRTAYVASFLMSKGLPLNYEVREYLSKVQDDILQDIINLRFHDVIYADTGAFTAGQIKDDETITLYNEWDVKLGKDSAFLEKFPRVPILAVNFEAIKHPECEEGKAPFMLWAKATRNGEVWNEEPSIIANEEQKNWRVVFGDLNVVDERSFNRRLFVVTYCADPETTDNE